MVCQVAGLGHSFQYAADKRLPYFRAKESSAVWVQATLCHLTLGSNRTCVILPLAEMLHEELYLSTTLR